MRVLIGDFFQKKTAFSCKAVYVRALIFFCIMELLSASALCAESCIKSLDIKDIDIDFFEKSEGKIYDTVCLKAEVFYPATPTTEENPIERHTESMRLFLLGKILADQPEEQDREKALSLFQQALNLNKESKEIRRFYALQLKELGHYQEALREAFYVRYQEKELDPFIKKLIIDLYIQEKDFKNLLCFFKKELLLHFDQNLFVEAFFWNKVTIPFIDWKEEVKRGLMIPSTSFNQSLLSLKQDTFWDQSCFKNFKEITPEMREYVFWLKNLQLLVEKEYKQALTSFKKEEAITFSFSKNLFESVYTLLEKKHNMQESFSPLFLEQKWDKAAIALYPFTKEEVPSSYPAWFMVSFGEALQEVKGTYDALGFFLLQKRVPKVQIELAKLYAKAGNIDSAESLIKDLAKVPSEEGKEASFFLATLYLQQNLFKEARQTVFENPLFFESCEGKKMLEQIPLFQKEIILGNEIKAALENKEIKTLCEKMKEAFLNKNYEDARDLNLQLLEKFPDHPVFQANLDKIEILTRPQKVSN